MCSELYFLRKQRLYHLQLNRQVIFFPVKIQIEVDSMLSISDEACIDILSLDISKRLYEYNSQ